MRGLGSFAALHGDIGVEGGIAGHGQDVAGIGLHDYDAAGGGVVRWHGGRDFALGDELNALIDGEREGGARLGGDGRSAERCRGGARR